MINVAVPFSSALQSLAALTAPVCSIGDSASSCNLSKILHVLYVVAGVLAAVLIVVIAFAVHAWRKTRETDLTRP